MIKNKERDLISGLLQNFCKRNMAKLAISAGLIPCLAIAQSVAIPGLLGSSLQAINGGQLPMLYRILGKIFLFSLFACIFMLISKWNLCVLKKRLDSYLEKTFICQLWSDGHFYERKKEEVSVLFRETITDFSTQVVEYARQVLYMAAVIITGSIYSISLSPQLYGLSILLTIAMILLLRHRVGVLEKKQRDFATISQEVNKKTWEQVLNHEVEFFLNPDKVIKGYHDSNVEFLRQLFSLKKTGNAFQAITMFTSFILMLCIGALGGILVLLKWIPMGVLYSLLFVLPNISSQMFGLPEMVSQLGRIKGIGGMLCQNFGKIRIEIETDEKGRMEIEKREGKKGWKARKRESKEGKNEAGCSLTPAVHENVDKIKAITAEGLSFGYKENQLLFSDVSFTMRPGEYWAFIGQIGCGKSTLVKLLVRRIPLKEGRVDIDGKDLSQIDRKVWWNSITYLDQDPHFIQGTILENILMGREYHKERVEKAIVEGDMEGMVNKLPKGVNAPIGGLSSGEKQKVCFARAFYRGNPVLFLDEATSALDLDSEKRICRTLKAKAEAGWLVVGISHREEFARQATKVLNFNGQTAAVAGAVC